MVQRLCWHAVCNCNTLPAKKAFVHPTDFEYWSMCGDIYIYSDRSRKQSRATKTFVRCINCVSCVPCETALFLHTDAFHRRIAMKFDVKLHLLGGAISGLLQKSTFMRECCPIFCKLFSYGCCTCRLCVAIYKSTVVYFMIEWLAIIRTRYGVRSIWHGRHW